MKKTHFDKVIALVFVIFWLISPSSLSIQKLTKKNTSKRKLVDAFQFKNADFYDDRTGGLRKFLEELKNSENTVENLYEVKTTMDSDNTSTTGNSNVIKNPTNFMPNYDSPIMNNKVYKIARKFHSNLHDWFSFLNLDLFSEDPQVFLGENKSYYLIVKKRGIIFYYLSRIILYGVLLYVLIHFVFNHFGSQKIEEIEPNIDKRANGFAHAQKALIILAMVVSFSILYFANKPRNEMNNVFSHLLLKFKNIQLKLNQIVDKNSSLNSKKVKIDSESRLFFTVQNRLKEAVEIAEMDSSNASDFIASFHQQKIVTDYSPAIVLSVSGFVMLTIHSKASTQKSYHRQLALFSIAALTLSYVFATLDKFFGGFSGINDFCMSILHYGKNGILPFQGHGVASFLGCSTENQIFQQLYINSIAQNSAFNIFNNALKVAGRKPVETIEEAFQVSAYLQSLEISSKQIDQYSHILQVNSEILKDLLSLKGCNEIRTWIDTAQTDMCIVASKSILITFLIYLFLCVILMSIFFISHHLMTILSIVKAKKKVEDFVYKKNCIENEVKFV